MYYYESMQKKTHRKMSQITWQRAIFTEPVQILSPLICLTSVFGMRTGVSTSLSPPDHFEVYPSKLNNS